MTEIVIKLKIEITTDVHYSSLYTEKMEEICVFLERNEIEFSLPIGMNIRLTPDPIPAVLMFIEIHDDVNLPLIKLAFPSMYIND